MRQDMQLERRRVPPRQIQAAHCARNVWSARRNQDIPHSVDSSRTSAPLTVVHAILSEYSAPRCGKHLPNPPNNACRPTLLAQPLTWARLLSVVVCRHVSWSRRCRAADAHRWAASAVRLSQIDQPTPSLCRQPCCTSRQIPCQP